MKFKTINPATGAVLLEHETQSQDDVFSIAHAVALEQKKWAALSLKERLSYVKRLGPVLLKHKNEYARLITLEMGKPITAARLEVEKCAWLCDVYCEKSEEWLKPEEVACDGVSHRVLFQPLGTILSIMPWNFPFWQALRFAVPTLIAGNTSLLKHSNVVPECALAIADALHEAGFPKYVFQTIIADHQTISALIQSDLIAGYSLTGSTEAGQRIAALAGTHLKKGVLELGGSDPFIVLEDASLAYAAKQAVIGRTSNCGQSCIAAKRFIVVSSVAEEFSKLFAEEMKKVVVGDPLQDTTQMGPLVNASAVASMEAFVSDAKAKGAIILVGGSRMKHAGYFFEPTLITNTTPDMDCVKNEVFGPIAPIIVVKNEEEAIALANSTEFGLGGSVWTKDLKRGMHCAERIESGIVSVNAVTRSDPRMPFGGVKKSGIGRELSHYGIREFVNIKSINVYESK